MSEPESSNRALTVLLVEDNSASQRLFTSMLESAGHRVRVAGNGVDALRLFIDQPPELVVIDLQMPILDGAETIPLLRALEPLDRRIPIVATTSRVEAVNQVRFLDAGADAFLAKPFTLNALRDTVQQTWSRLAVAAKRAPPATTPVPQSDRSDSSAGKPRAPVDLAGALVRLGGDKKLLADLVGFFFEDAFGLLSRIRASVHERQWDDARRTAHSLKGLSANFGAAPAVAALQAIESCSDDPPGIEGLMHDVDREVARLAAALAAEGLTG